MRKRISSILAASLFLLVGTMGCKDDDCCTTGPISSGEQGVPTEISIHLKFHHSTRATADSNSTEEEAALKMIDIFIYDEAGDFLERHTLSPDEFSATDGGPGYDAYQTVPLPATTGDRSVYVGINLPPAVASSLDGNPLSTASTAVQTIDPSDINATDGIPMFSNAAVHMTFVEDSSANNVVAPVKRLASKVTVETDPLLDQGALGGQLGEFFFTLNNRNRKFFLQQNRRPYADPNWTAGSYDPQDFKDSELSDYVKVAVGPQDNINNYNAKYVLENTSELKMMKELTRITVRTQFSPYVFLRFINNELRMSDNNDLTPRTFYTVVPPDNPDHVAYFDNTTDAGNYAAYVGTTYSTYTDGWCYWSVFMNNDHPGEILRNEYFKCVLTRIFPPGQPSAALANPDGHPNTYSDIFVDVQLQGWNDPWIYNNVTLQP